MKIALGHFFSVFVIHVTLVTPISLKINLSLHFLEEHLQFVFKYIDPKDEEKPFVFTVAITNHDKYNGNNANVLNVFMFKCFSHPGV